MQNKLLKQGVKFCQLSLLVFMVSQLLTIFAVAQSLPMKTIHGSIWYRERIMPPPEAEIMISLVGVAKMNVAATVITSKRFDAVGGPPWDFTLQYDSQKLNSKGRYVLQARLEAKGRLHFISTSHIPAFDHDPPKG